MAERSLLRVENLTTQFEVPAKGFFKPPLKLTAVNNVSFDLIEGRTLGIVGESGCGKSTLGRSILRLLKSQNGRILWQGRNLLDLSDDRSRSCQAVDAIAEQHLAEVDRKIADLQALRRELASMIDQCRCGTVAECRIIDALRPRYASCRPGPQ